MFTVIAYDIVDDRTRMLVARELRAVSVRVQKSVFEAPSLKTPDLERLRRRLESRIDESKDKVRYYPLCATCRERVLTSGRGSVTPYEEYKVI